MSINIYLYGCNCGTTAMYIRKIKAYGQSKDIEVKLFETKYNEISRVEHLFLLGKAGINNSSYQTIVEYKGKVKKLSEFIV